MSSPFKALVVLLLLAVQWCSADMASWLTGRGPQLIEQDTITGQIIYSMCNSNNSLIMPSPPLAFSPTSGYAPRNGTALAGIGWSDTVTTYVSKSRHRLAAAGVTVKALVLRLVPGFDLLPGRGGSDCQQVLYLRLALGEVHFTDA